MPFDNAFKIWAEEAVWLSGRELCLTCNRFRVKDPKTRHLRFTVVGYNLYHYVYHTIRASVAAATG